MAKRKSKTTAEFKPPKRTQPRAKRQKSTEETNQSEDESQTLTPESENTNSHNALCSDKLDEHQPGQSTLKVTQTTEFPVDPCCSLEEKTRHDDNIEHGNGTNPPEVSHEIEQTAAIVLQTPDLDNSDKHTLSRPLNTEAINVDQPNTELDEEESEITSRSNLESQKVPDDCDSELPSDEHQTERELPHEENTATEPKMGEQLGSSDIITETSVDQTGIQMPEDAGSADPLVKRKIRKRMGMGWLGERKKVLKGQLIRENAFGGSQENEAGQVTNEEPVMTSDSLKKDISISVEEEGVTESEVSATPCPMEDIPVQKEQEQRDVQYGNEVQILVECMSSEHITHETDNTIPSHADADADDLNPLEQKEIKCMEQNANESNIREDSIDVTNEIGTEVPVCKDSTDVSAQEEVVIAGSLEVPKEANESSTSTAEVANHFQEELVKGGDNIEQCCPCECDMNGSISIHTNEQCLELMDIAADETISAPPVIYDETEDKCKSSDFTLVATTVTAENKADCENNSMSSLPLPAAPLSGENEDVQSFAEHESLPSDAHEPCLSRAAEPDPSSPLSMHSVTDSQLNNIPLSLEDLPISEASCDMEDATELVCGLIRDIAYLNQILMDTHRKIGFGQQGRKPPRPQPHTQKYKHNANRF